MPYRDEETCHISTLPLLPGGGGVLEVYMTGSDGVSHCKPKQIQEPEILDPPPPKKKTWHQNIPPQKNKTTSNTDLFNQTKLFNA